ncbi:MT-A70 family methyltransferase [Hafnia psychrotolerans]|uniref:Adenine methyltransferase n=1 Tax=Hafnia psychrotolerans TaxID=1477018 RepID=A0ABQ1FXX5_9GAMM|nr:MT-A70 family methyltransferase [Hafnia psychrotolerans]GGA33645.1 adenine methyltransferase [Hafnia psychrotolerans]
MYQLIYADPPWRYQNKGVNGAAENHYQTMTLEDMKRLPVWSIAADDAVLCMWFTGTHVDEAKELAKAWGFEVRTMKGLTWVKLNELAWQHIEKRLREQDVLDFHDFLELLNTQTRMNGGTYTRANSEDMLIAVRGAGLQRAAMNVKQVVYSCLGEHSEKPAEGRFRLEQLYGNVSRIELFSRGDAPGWHHWGNENPFNDIDLVPATFTAMPPNRNSRVKALAGHYRAIPANVLHQSQQQNIPETIPEPATANTVWPAEVNYLLDQVANSSSLEPHLQNKLRFHINRLKMDGLSTAAIIATAGTLARAMGATA